MSTGVGRISIVVPGASASAAADRDAYIAQWVTSSGIWRYFRYSDTNSGLGAWGYYAVGWVYAQGIITVVTVTCTGMAHPPSGSNLVAMADPGVGSSYTWVSIGAPFGLSTSGGGGGGASAPQQNNNYWTWHIPGNSPTAATDFTNAINKFGQICGALNYYKYVDSVSGAWAVYALGEYAGPSAGLAPIYFRVTCAGTPNPPTGSSAPAVSIPAFTQTFTAITAPLVFGPMR